MFRFRGINCPCMSRKREEREYTVVGEACEYGFVRAIHNLLAEG